MSEEKKEAGQTGTSEQPKTPEAETAAPEAETPSADTGKKTDKKEKKKDRRKDGDRSAELEQALGEANDKFLRLCAEYDNYRRRSQREKDALYADIKAETVQKFLPVYDNLERALRQSTEDEAYRKGVEMIMTQFSGTLEKLGVTLIEAQGSTFDPSLHNAVMHVDDPEKGENEIVEVFQQGFRLGDKVIRFAMVKVAN